MLGFIYVSIFCIYTLHITYLYFNSWQCLTLTVILWNFWIIWIVWQWWTGVFKWLKSGPGVDTQYLVTSLRQLIHLSAAFSSPLLWPKWWYFSFRKTSHALKLFPDLCWKGLGCLEQLRKHSETQKPGKNARGTQKNTCWRLAPPVAPPFFCWKCSSSFVRSLSCLTFGTHGVLKSLACWVGSLWMLQKEHEEWCEGKTLPAAFETCLFGCQNMLRWHSWLDMSRKMLLTTTARCHWYCPQASVC